MLDTQVKEKPGCLVFSKCGQITKSTEVTEEKSSLVPSGEKNGSTSLRNLLAVEIR